MKSTKMITAVMIGMACAVHSADAGWFDGIKEPQTKEDKAKAAAVELSKGEEADKRKDYKQAFTHYKRAAEQDSVDGQYMVGRMYLDGEGVEKDGHESAKWFGKAAERGDARAQRMLGVMYQSGNGVEKNESLASNWFRKAAEQGDPTAQFGLGGIYFNGHGVKKDLKQAAAWLKKAAEQGHSDAQTLLGYLYESGSGVSKSYKEASLWYGKAAEQGNSTAQENLSQLHQSGQAVGVDAVKAKAWGEAARKREKVEAEAKRTARREAYQSEMACKCQATQRYIEEQIAREQEIGRVSGFVDKTRLHKLGQNLVTVREYLAEIGGRTPASNCNAKATVDTFQYCLEAAATSSSRRVFGE